MNDVLARLRDTAEVTRERLDIVERVVATLRDPTSALGARLRLDALRESGLSAPMIDWALATTLGGILGDLPVFARRASFCENVANAALVLSGNVFTAPADPLVACALAGVHTRVKVASADGSFARAFVDAIEDTSSSMREQFTLYDFDRHDEAAVNAVFSTVEVVIAYGSDDTMNALRPRVPASARFVAEGHGFGLVFVDHEACREGADDLFGRIALDVAAYDQRGCRSPAAIVVDADSSRAKTLASQLRNSLDLLENALPRGPMDIEAEAAERRWLTSMQALGEVYASASANVALVDDVSLLSSPLYRNVPMIALDEEAFLAFLARASTHVKVVGTSMSGEKLDAFAKRLSSAAPRAEIVPVGALQTPRYLAFRAIDALRSVPAHNEKVESPR